MSEVSDEIRHVTENYFKAEHKSSLKKSIRESKIKAIVFIDELDRCPLERIVDILEAIKLFLAEEIFIVLIAVDTRVASEAIHLRYKDVGNPALAREYLEKIIQIPMPIPRARRDQVEEYLKDMMKVAESNKRVTTAMAAMTSQHQVSPRDSVSVPPPLTSGAPPNALGPSSIPAKTDSSTDLTTSAQATISSIESPTPSISGTKSIIVQKNQTLRATEMTDTQDEFDMIAEMGSACLQSNPRRLKRLINTYRYIKLLSKANNELVHEPTWQKEMLAWLVFTFAWPDFMRRLIQEAEKQVNAKKQRKDVKQESFMLHCYDSFGTITVGAVMPEMKREYAENHFEHLTAERALRLRDLASNFLIENPESAQQARLP